MFMTMLLLLLHGVTLKEGNELVVEKGYYLMTIGEAEVFQKFFKNYEFN